MTVLQSTSEVRLSIDRIRDFLLLSFGRIGFVVCKESVRQSLINVYGYKYLRYFYVEFFGRNLVSWEEHRTALTNANRKGKGDYFLLSGYRELGISEALNIKFVFNLLFVV